MQSQIIELRDFSALLPPVQQSEIEWSLRDYMLIDQTKGRMLWADGHVSDIRDYSGGNLPCTLEYDPHLTGIYEIHAGIPIGNDRPLMPNIDGVDLALDGEAFIHIYYDYGVRYGCRLCESQREYFVKFKTADMTGRKLLIRVPFGTFQSIPVGYVRAALSSLRFVPVSEPPAESLPKKKVGVICDGFSHYFTWAKPGENIDLRPPQTYTDSDVRMIFHQIAGTSLWKSDVTYYMGENLDERDMAGKRSGDIRTCDYLRWAVTSGRNILAEEAESCHKNNIELHFSIRANLYWANDSNAYLSGTAKFMNGRFWHEHPECRIPGEDARLDYANHAVRNYYLTLFREALEQADFDGLNLDLTRWPPVFKKEYHTPDVLISFMRELRVLADEYGKKRGKKIAVSLLMVEGFHAGMPLEEQCIDFDALMASGTLDFVCVESSHLERYIDDAHKRSTPIYALYDDDGAFAENGYRNDPLWVAPQYSRAEADDPRAGEEFRSEPILRSRAAPWEIAVLANRDYAKGADGFVTVNRFMGDRTISDLGDPDRAHTHSIERSAHGQSSGDYLFVLKN